ncbi:unnamed protein product [Cylindrotheca closterium]|uniref:Peptidase M41 domain-containing protein n=1 Tax=Cylindrotheca closterium TaxID=2856 RepID=A0AAD2CD93_9STRA|nr:unnamed protein product [Cylindrotheca closterium]
MTSKNTKTMNQSVLVVLTMLSTGNLASAFVTPSSGKMMQAMTTAKSRQYSLLATAEDEQKFDEFLAKNELKRAVDVFKSYPDLELTRDRWNSIFDTIEEVTTDAEEINMNKRMEGETKLLSKSRRDMTDMYTALKNQGELRLFGAINKENMPANGSHSVQPTMLEQISSVSLDQLTPKPSNTMLFAGISLATLEAIISGVYGIDLNFLFFATIIASLGDRILLNGAISETFLKTISPKTQPKITRHEAGHFLCAYLLGCPVEGYVLSAWAALKDPRFGSRAVSAGTSFFDPALSAQIESTKITRSSIDRYSVIVMAGIAAEALNYGQADGGAGDEAALITFLANLNGPPSATPAWNDITIRNQARWGALQAVLMLKEYKECYDALVDALERGGSLGDCIYAIENAGRIHNKVPLQKPLGYILEKETDEEWVTELPQSETAQEAVVQKAEPAKPMDAAESLETLKELKELAQQRVKEIEEKLEKLR